MDLFKMHRRPFVVQYGRHLVRGLISVSKEYSAAGGRGIDRVFLCHNCADMAGLKAMDKLGFEYSYTLIDDSGHIEIGSVIKSLDIDVPDEPIFPKGSVLGRIGTEACMQVKEVLGDLVFCCWRGAISAYEANQLHLVGWRIKEEPPKPKELVLTMDEVASKFGIDVKLLKIKK